MLAELRMKLDAADKELGYYQSSNLQGVLMEKLDSAYAEKLHEQGPKPYSQYIIGKEQKEWVIKTFTEDAFQEILSPLMRDDFSEFTIEKKAISVKITEKNLKTIQKKKLMDEFYHTSCSGRFCLEFLTPTSFKSGGRYVIMPDLRYIFQSLMNKYSASSDMNMYDEETLEQLIDNSYITGYRLQSKSFPLENVKIPSFQGEMTIKMTGTETMARYARLLIRFGEYSGVGIKTAIGMGAFRGKEVGRKND